MKAFLVQSQPQNAIILRNFINPPLGPTTLRLAQLPFTQQLEEQIRPETLPQPQKRFNKWKQYSIS